MQGFVPASNTSTTYRSVSFDTSVSVATVYPLHSGQLRSFDSVLGAINTTATGVWVIGSSPSTYFTSATTATTTSTDPSTVPLRSNSWTGPAVTFTNSNNSTYAESVGWTYTSAQSHTETYTATFQVGTGTTSKSSIYLTTSIGTSPATGTANTTNSAYQWFPGCGGIPNYLTGAATINCNQAAVSLAGGSTSWSTAFPNFGQVVML